LTSLIGGGKPGNVDLAPIRAENWILKILPLVMIPLKRGRGIVITEQKADVTQVIMVITQKLSLNSILLTSSTQNWDHDQKE
jgi:hypothetical protein